MTFGPIEAPGPLAALAAVASGVFTWSLLEYLLHRFLGHDRRFFPNPFELEHTRHHAEGGYFAPGFKKALVALAVLAVAIPLASLAMGLALGALWAGSFVAMYVVYELFHRRLHTHEGFGGPGRFLRRHHFHHHFVNPRANHGVTSPLWDVVFRTYERTGRTRVPWKLRMDWLVDESTGDVHERLAGHYELARPRTERVAR